MAIDHDLSNWQMPGVDGVSQKRGSWTPDECGLVAESAEPESSCTRSPPWPIRWTRTSTMLKHSRAST